MASLVLSGDTSGSVTIAAPAVAGSTTQTLVNVTGTLAPIVSGTSQTAPFAVNTLADFTGIPSWAKRVTVMFQGVSTSGSGLVLIQLGTASSFETTGYSGSTQFTASYVAYSTYTGVPLDTLSSVAAGTVRSGTITFTLQDATTNTWTVFGGVSIPTGASALILTAGFKPLASALTRVRVTTSNGTDTFDTGCVINILYE